MISDEVLKERPELGRPFLRICHHLGNLDKHVYVDARLLCCNETLHDLIDHTLLKFQAIGSCAELNHLQDISLAQDFSLSLRAEFEEKQYQVNVRLLLADLGFIQEQDCLKHFLNHSIVPIFEELSFNSVFYYGGQFGYRVSEVDCESELLLQSDVA
jgi:hypothetical protein